jgi:hypothetical protein
MKLASSNSNQRIKAAISSGLAMRFMGTMKMMRASVGVFKAVRHGRVRHAQQGELSRIPSEATSRSMLMVTSSKAVSVAT